jgi:cyclase
VTNSSHHGCSKRVGEFLNPGCMLRPFALVPLVTVALAISATRARGQDFSKVEIKTSKVGEGVYVLFGDGGNIGASVGDDGVILVDDQFGELTPKIQAALAALTKKPVRFVINTHVRGLARTRLN